MRNALASEAAGQGEKRRVMTPTRRRPRQSRAVFAMTRYALLAQLRNPGSLFFGFLFPVLFVVVFGLLGNSDVSTNIGIPDDVDRSDPVMPALMHVGVVQLSSGDEASLEQQLRKGKLDAIVRTRQTGYGTPATYTVDVITSTANPIKGQAAVAAVRGAASSADLELLGAAVPPVTVTQREVSGRTERYIDFALPGQIGFALLGTAVFGTTFGLIYLKKALVLKRMFATPVRGASILLAQGLSRLVIVLAQAALILTIGVVAFHFYLPKGAETFGAMLLLVGFGLIVFLGMGLLIAGLTNDENSANPITNLVTLPQFLLAGTFFPTDAFPSWVQPVANNLPLSYLNAGLRKIASDGATFDQVLPYVLGLGAWGLLAYLAAAKTFKWQ